MLVGIDSIVELSGLSVVENKDGRSMDVNFTYKIVHYGKLDQVMSTNFNDAIVNRIELFLNEGLEGDY